MEVYKKKFKEYTYSDEVQDIIIGGKADNKDIDDFDPDQIAKGIEVEGGEHTDDPYIAAEIATDHLEEIPDYYDRLADMEDEAKAEMEDENEDEIEYYVDYNEDEDSEENDERKIEIEVDLEKAKNVKKIEIEVYLEKYISIYDKE